MFNYLKSYFSEAFASIMPVVVVVLVLSTYIPVQLDLLLSFLISSALLIMGSALFTFGAELSMVVIGNKIGKSLVKSKKVWLILLVSFVIGTVITIAEPDLMVLAEQLTNVSSLVLILTISLGVGVCILLASLRSLLGWDLNIMLLIGFILIFVMSYFVPVDFIPVAFDSGGVTTGTMSIPFIMTLGMGLVANRIDKKAKEDSFGLIALASTGPIIMVMLLGLLYNTGGSSSFDHSMYTQFSFKNYFVQFVDCFKDVILAVLPIVVVFIIYQLLTKKVSKKEMHKIVLGLIVTIIGLNIFLVACNVGYINMGYYIGEYISLTSFKYLLIPIIMLIAFFIAIAEPAVMILIEQVSEFTEGSISKQVLKIALALGVSIAAGLSMWRVFTGVPFINYAIVGYGVCLLLMLFIPKVFTAIAFDAGGATGGSLTTAFLLPMAIGASVALGGNVLTDAFGLASMVSLVPIITIQLVGVYYQIRLHVVSRVDALDDSIVDYEWGNSND